MVYLQLNKFNNLARNAVIMTNVQRLLVSRPVSRVLLLQSGSVEDADARPEVFPRLLPVLLDAKVVDDGRAAAHHENVDLAGEFLNYTLRTATKVALKIEYPWNNGKEVPRWGFLRYRK